MPKGHLMVIDPGVLTPSIESFNRISKVTPLNVSYHLPALFGPKSLLKATKDNNISGIIIRYIRYITTKLTGEPVGAKSGWSQTRLN